MVRHLTGSISRITKATEDMARGHFVTRVNERRNDELGRLGQAINLMAGQLDHFVKGQKRFLGDIAHELCSPLVRMEMGLSVLEQRAPGALLQRLEDVREEVREMSGLVNELLSFSKAGLMAEGASLESVDLTDLVETTIMREATGGIQVHSELPADARVFGVHRLLERALSNVLRNARRYAGDAGPISVSARAIGSTVELTVIDQGPGVPAEALARLFDAFYRPDQARSRETGGSGLGLAIVKTCVEACQGKVSATNRPEGGLEVKMTLVRDGG
jgi:two-component system sensor histidine kinase CpxA